MRRKYIDCISSTSEALILAKDIQHLYTAQALCEPV